MTEAMQQQQGLPTQITVHQRAAPVKMFHGHR